MRVIILSAVISSVLLGCGGSSDDNANTTVETKPVSDTATYELTVNSNWDVNKFSTNFPPNRHFSGVVGLTHNADGKIFKLAELASAGIVQVAETGNKTKLLSEIGELQNNGYSFSTIDGSGITVDQNSVTLTFNMSKDHPYISFVTMLAPSPDWFTGVNSYQLFSDDKWIESVEVPLNTYDAGSDSGLIFTSVNAPTTPPDVITRLTTERIDTDFDNGVHYSSSLPITTVTIKRLN